MSTDQEKFAKNWNVLAERLGVSRKTVLNWRKDARLRDHCPQDRSDGRKEVGAWKAFMQTFQLKRADEAVGTAPPPRPSGDAADVNPCDAIFEDLADGDGLKPDGSVVIGGYRFPPGRESDWKKLLLEQKVKQATNHTKKQEGELLVAAELEVALGQLIAGLSTALNHFPSATARFLVGIRDVHIVQQRLESEINAVLQRLNACRYLAVSIDDAVRELGNDPESSRLLEVVNFAGQDRQQLLQVVQLVASRAVAAVGRRVLEEINAGPAIAHDVTGQVTDGAAELQAVTRNEPSGDVAAAASSGNGGKRTDPRKKGARKTAAGKRAAPRGRKAQRRRKSK